MFRCAAPNKSDARQSAAIGRPVRRAKNPWIRPRKQVSSGTAVSRKIITARRSAATGPGHDGAGRRNPLQSPSGTPIAAKRRKAVTAAIRSRLSTLATYPRSRCPRTTANRKTISESPSGAARIEPFPPAGHGYAFFTQ